MNVVVSLSPSSSGKKPEVGDILKIQLFFAEKIGSQGDGWEVVSANSTAWLTTGSLTVSTMSVRSLPVDGNTTKLELDGMVHQPGPIVVGSFFVRNQVT